jgi:uncharacterized protein (DUF1778 family)|tara:strand:+ start:130 stop:378 length:249 start_codon:yes stop_codon:yes gene_type:complete
MAYRNKRQKKTNEVKVRFSDEEQSLIDRAVDIDGGQRAVISRELILRWAAEKLANAPAALIARQNFGVVNPDGEIKYRFAVA